MYFHQPSWYVPQQPREKQLRRSCFTVGRVSYFSLSVSSISQLSAGHNFGVKIPPDLKWTDLFSYHFLQDGSTAIEQGDPPNRNHPERYSLHLVLTENNNDNVWEQVTQMENLTFQQQDENLSAASLAHREPSAFLWDIRYTMWTYSWRVAWGFIAERKESAHYESIPELWDMPEFSDYTKSCNYVYTKTAPLIERHAQKAIALIETMHPSIDTIGTLHIRRNDAKTECNTSLDHVHDYLTCSFQNATAKLGNTAVLFFSDEEDHCYRTAIQHLIEEGLGHKFVDLDDLIWTVVKNHVAENPGDTRLLNNMYIFHVLENFVKHGARIEFVLEQRRTFSCPACTHIASKLDRASSSHGEDTLIQHASNFTLSGLLDDYATCTNKSQVKRH